MNVGLDLGYSEVKAVAGPTNRVSFSSVVGTPEQSRFRFSENGGGICLVAPNRVLVGDEAITQSRFLIRREDRSWIKSDDYYDLFLAALTELTTATVVELRIVTGLPVSFYDDKATLRDLLLGEHRPQRKDRNAQLFKVIECRVIPQPFGCLLAEALDDRGAVVNGIYMTGTCGVIDVGGKTTNLLSVSRLSEVARESASVSVGAWDVVRAVREWITAHTDLDPRDHEIVDHLRGERVLKERGKPLDLALVIEAAVEPLAEQIIAQAGQLWNGGAALDAILITGGGARLVGRHIQAHFEHARVVSDPVFANAIGYYRFAQHLGRLV